MDSNINVMKKSKIHENWINSYRIGYANKFYEISFAEIAEYIKSNKLCTVLDAGCGTGAKSFILANHGLHVTGCDFSEVALNIASLNQNELYGEQKIKFYESDITNLCFGDGVFDAVVCWGVLMHVEDISKALEELGRIVRPGGMLVIGINNHNSLDSLLAACSGRFRKGISEKGEEGTKRYIKTNDGDLLVRHTDVHWMIGKIIDCGYILDRHTAGQMTEFYTRNYIPNFAKNFIHIINNLWFKYIKLPRLCAGNILYFKKKCL